MRRRWRLTLRRRRLLCSELVVVRTLVEPGKKGLSLGRNDSLFMVLAGKAAGSVHILERHHRDELDLTV